MPYPPEQSTPRLRVRPGAGESQSRNERGARQARHKYTWASKDTNLGPINLKITPQFKNFTIPASDIFGSACIYKCHL